MLNWLEERNKNKIHQVGAKVAHLSGLSDRYPIPMGFCLSIRAHQQWLKAGQPATMPSALQIDIEQIYQQLLEKCGDLQPRLAVRSSAVDEDSPIASFAGQYESYLNVRGPEALQQAIIQCWQSGQTERVKSYRTQHAESSHQLQLAVFVQLMVKADISWVAFSRNPLRTDSHEMMINATWGLGESLVKGTTTPDTYIIHKTDGMLIKKTIGSKEHMTVLQEEGIQEVKVPRPMRALPVLNEKQMDAVAQLTHHLEQEMGWAVDIEGAYADNQLYLLQCRPITT